MLKRTIILVCAALLIGLNLDATTPQTVSQEQLDLRIPVVDMQDFYNPEKQEQFLKTLSDAMREIGFFAVRNTGVDAAVIKNAYAQSERFFKQNSDFKSKSYFPDLHGQRGFVPGETAKGHGAKDFKEFYHIGRELSLEEHKETGITPNVWPEQEGFKEAMNTLYAELEQYVIPLQEAIVAVINQNAREKISCDSLEMMTEKGDSLLRALYYPALSEEQVNRLNQPLFWAAEHTDIDLMTLLPFATEKGLQILYKGQWLNVVVPSDAFIVNIGDMLENLTNGFFVSARHRVLAQDPDKDRFSMVFFVHPTSDTSLLPFTTCIEQTGDIQKYADGTRLEFLWERLLELNIAPDVLVPYSKTGHTERQILFGRESPQVVKMLVDNGLASEQLLQEIEKKKAH